MLAGTMALKWDEGSGSSRQLVEYRFQTTFHASQSGDSFFAAPTTIFFHRFFVFYFILFYFILFYFILFYFIYFFVSVFSLGVKTLGRTKQCGARTKERSVHSRTGGTIQGCGIEDFLTRRSDLSVNREMERDAAFSVSASKGLQFGRKSNRCLLVATCGNGANSFRAAKTAGNWSD